MGNFRFHDMFEMTKPTRQQQVFFCRLSPLRIVLYLNNITSIATFLDVPIAEVPIAFKLQILHRCTYVLETKPFLRSKNDF